MADVDVPKRITLLPLEVGYFKTYEEYFSHFEVELYSSLTPSTPGGGIDLSKKKGDTVELKGTRSGYMYVSGTHTFQRLVKGKYYYIRYRVVTIDGRHSQWQSEEQCIGDSSITFTKSGSSVISLNGIITATVSISLANIPADFKQIHWFVRSADFSGTIQSNTVPDYITDSIPPDGNFTLKIPADTNKKIYFVAVDYSSNKHATTAEYVGTVATPTAPGVPTCTYGNGNFKLSFSYNFDTNPDVTRFDFSVSLDNGSTYLIYNVPRPEGGGTQTVSLSVPAVKTSGNCYFKHRVRAVNSINMTSAYSTLTTNNAIPPNISGFSGTSLTYANRQISLSFSFSFSGDNADVKSFRVEVARTNAADTVKYNLPAVTACVHTWAIESGETYTVNVYAVDSMGLESAAKSIGSITAPYDMQDVTQLSQLADIFHFDKTGYGSVRGIYPSIINGVPQLRGKYFSKFGNAVEFAEATTNTGRNPVFEDNTNWGDYSYNGGSGTRTFGYTITDLDEKIPTALRLVKTDGGSGRWGVIQINSAWSNVTYTFSFYFKVLSYSSGAVLHLDHAGGSITTVTLLDSHVGKWTRVVGTSSATLGNRYIWLEGNNADVLITAWQAEQKSYATPFHTLSTYNKSADQTSRVAQYLKYPVSNLIDLSAGSISFWFIPDWNYNVSGMSYAMLFSCYTSDTDRFEVHYTVSQQKFRVEITDGTITDFSASSVLSFSRGNRIFITVTWNSSTINLYVNASYKNSGTMRHPALADGLCAIGSRKDGSLISNGCIDELIFWKGYTLTDNQVKKLYELEQPNIYPNPIKKVAPIIKPSNDFIYSQLTSQPSGMSAETYNRLGQRFTGRNIQ